MSKTTQKDGIDKKVRSWTEKHDDKKDKHDNKNDKNLNKSPKYDEKVTEIIKTCQQKCKTNKDGDRKEKYYEWKVKNENRNE